jgi:hypothetical protein
MIRYAPLLVVALLLTSTPLAKAGFNNGGFESGLSGWSTTGTAVTTGTPLLLGIFANAQGNYAQLRPGNLNVNNVAALQSALGLTTATIGSVINAGQTPASGVAIYQTVSVNLGDKIAFDWHFVDNDEIADDTAFVTIGNSIVRLLGSEGSVEKTGSGSFLSTGFTSGGSFTIGAGIVNVISPSDDSDSVLFVDNFRIIANPNSGGNNTAVVPEPSTLTLLGLAGLAGGVYGWRRQRAAKA